MNVILFGATGMVGQGALRECLLDADVERVLAIGRSATGQHHAKLVELVLPDPSVLSSASDELAGYDACLFCLGVSSAGMSEADYKRVTCDMPVAVAEALVQSNPDMTFIYVSGAGTDSTEHGRTMWARVKGAAENALLKVPFKGVYMFRPAFIQPLHGIVSRTALYRILYALLRPLYPVLRALMPSYVTTTEKVGRAMLVVARRGATKRVLDNRDINALVPP